MNKGLRFAFLVAGCSGWLAGCGGGSGSTPPPDLSGSIAIEANTRVDLDTADEERAGVSISNSDPASAQPLPANATIGGYLSANGGTYNNPVGTFPFGPFRYFKDDADFYIAELVAGDRISFQVFASPSQFLISHTDPPSRQIRVLKSEAGGLVEVVDPVDRSGDLDPLTITLPDDFESGSYLVELTASSGMPFRYVLSLADLAATSGVNAQYVEPTFIMDQAVVRMKPQIGPQVMARAAGATGQKSLGDGAWLMQRGNAQIRVLSDQAKPDDRRATLDWVRALGAQHGVMVAEPNYVYTSQQVSPDNDDFYRRQWNLPFTQTPLAWQVAPNNGAGIGIAVLDTGLFRSPPDTGGDWHPDLDANVRLIAGQQMDFVTGDRDIDDTPGRDDNPADPGDGRAQSSNFHGTHVAGIAAAADNDIGIVGVAPEALIYPVRVLGREGVGSSADLIAAINWAAGRPEIDVLNLSLGGLGDSAVLRNAIDAAWNDGRGKLVVAAAGNAATDQPTYPAAYQNVIGVGAVDGAGVRADYSNTGPSVDVMAPGGDASRDADQDGFADLIVSTYGTDDGESLVPGYTSLQGTSMAAPHVAGVYALMKGEVATLSPVGFRAFLRAGALTRPVGPASEYGFGLIDALAAMDAALDGNLPVTLSSAPSALQFNSAVLTAVLTLTPFPEDEVVTVISATSQAPWLTANLDSDNPLEVVVTANIADLDPQGRYIAELVIDYDPDTGAADTLTVPVSLQLGTAADAKDAGRHYVLLVNADDEDADIQQSVVTAANGRYRFAFEDVEPGNYFLVAGTDTDNNGLICENGEACAEYPLNGLPETIRLGDAPQNGVALNTSFRRPTLSALGLPRVGFEGYRVKSGQTADTDGQSRKEYVR